MAEELQNNRTVHVNWSFGYHDWESFPRHKATAIGQQNEVRKEYTNASEANADLKSLGFKSDDFTPDIQVNVPFGKVHCQTFHYYM